MRKLPAIETLGAATVICSDKTGTLTRNEMTVRAIATGGALIDVGGSGYSPEGDFTRDGKPLAPDAPVRAAVTRTLRAAALVNDAALTESDGRWKVQGDPTEGALIVAARKLGMTEQELARVPRVAEIPFTSERKRHTTLHADPAEPGAFTAFVKGAPEVLLAHCRHVFDDDGKPVALTTRARRWSRRNEALAGQALRTLAIASRNVPAAALGIDPQASDIELPEASRTISSCSASSA